MSQRSTAGLVVLMFLGTAAAYWSQGLKAAGVLLTLGLGYGFVFYRARLCFASAFYGNRELMRGILVGLAVASLGAAAVIALGLNRAPRVPFGLHTLVGAAAFGFALPFAGGCMTGTLYRLGGGQTKALAAFAGILVGNGLGAAFAWRLTEPMLALGARLYLPDLIGLLPSLALNLAGLAVLFWYLRDSAGREGSPARAGPAHAGAAAISAPSEPVSPSARPVAARSIFTGVWPAWAGGVALAALFVTQFAYHSTLAVQVPLARLALWVSGLAGLPVRDLAWSQFWGLRIPAMDPGFHLDVGLVTGAMAAALTMGEFGYFRHWNARAVVSGFLGGVLMGVAVWIAIGCNVSGFWSTVATLRFEGWIYALGMLIGTRLGLKATAALVGRGLL